MLKSLYGNITVFPKKVNAFETWKCGETIPTIARARHVHVADAMVEIYIIDYIARGQGYGKLHRRIVNELGIDRNKFENGTRLPYQKWYHSQRNQINGFHL